MTVASTVDEDERGRKERKQGKVKVWDSSAGEEKGHGKRIEGISVGLGSKAHTSSVRRLAPSH